MQRELQRLLLSAGRAILDEGQKILDEYGKKADNRTAITRVICPYCSAENKITDESCSECKRYM